MNPRRVVVTGLGALNPIGNTIPAYWEGLLSGTSGAAPITYFDASLFKTKFACEVKDLNVENFIDRKEMRRMDRYSHLGIISATEAIEDSKCLDSNFDSDRCGVIWGSGIGGIETFFEEATQFAKGDGSPRFSPFFIPKII